MTNPIPIVRTIPYSGSRRTLTASFNGTLTIYGWGGGGGGGGNDAGTRGGEGAPGLFASTTIDFAKGDVIEVVVGSGGRAGTVGKSATGGTPGSGRLNVSGNSNYSFNGGAGGNSGGSGISGSGGGGGGATVVLKNGIPVLVAGGGGGGGGAGNDGNSSTNIQRRAGTVLNNATKNYFPQLSLAIDVTNSASYEISPSVLIDNYSAFTNLAAPPTIPIKVCVFGTGGIPAGSNNRTITSKNKVDLSSSDVIGFYVNRGTEADWGQKPDSNEELYLEYSGNGSNWVVIETVPITLKANTWVTKIVTIPAGAKGPNGVYIRLRQNTTGDSSTKRDTWAMSSVQYGSLAGIAGIDFRGENGQTKAGDGGGGGGGGGGYPGGQGGQVFIQNLIFSPDSSAYAGQCGGNYPPEDANYLSSPWFARGGVGAWSSFMNTYAVWPAASDSVSSYTVYRMFTAPYNGTYNFRFSADNSGTLYVNDQLLASATGFGTAPPLVPLTLDAGTHRIKMIVANAGGPGGFAMTIEDSKGGLLWDTRKYADVYPPGKDNRYYQSGVALGGQMNGNGGNGFAALVFNPIAEYKASSAIKVAGEWKQVTDSYVKVAGEWKSILKTYVKVNGTWRPVESATDLSLAEFTSVSGDFGVNTRSFS